MSEATQKKTSKSKKSSAVAEQTTQTSGLAVRGNVFVGKVVSNVFHKTCTVEWGRRHFVPKYERYEKRRTRVKVHVPESFNIAVGDTVKIGQTRPLSKTKHFVVIERVEK